jgi:hypothetical protein
MAGGVTLRALEMLQESPTFLKSRATVFMNDVQARRVVLCRADRNLSPDE